MMCVPLEMNTVYLCYQSYIINSQLTSDAAVGIALLPLQKEERWDDIALLPLRKEECEQLEIERC